MRIAGPLLLAAVLLAGCTGGGFPQGSRVVAELEVGDLGPSEAAASNFSLDAGTGFLLVGFRTGPATGRQVTFQSPGGQVFDALSAAPEGPCAVRSPAAGAWSLHVRTDPFDGSLRKGKFTVRTNPGDPPGLLSCMDDAFPAKGRVVTLVMVAAVPADFNASGNGSTPLLVRFDQPFDLSGLHVAVRNELPAQAANVSEAPPRNLSAEDLVLMWRAPGASSSTPTVEGTVAHGSWELRWALREGATLPSGNVTLAVRGTGA